MTPSQPRYDPGRGLTECFVNARGRRLRAVRAGTGWPLVVFESGLGASASLWAEVQRQVAAQTATLSYDRAGYVGSRPAKDGRLLADINADLEALLDALSYEGPLVLVGQSWGGPIVRAMAQTTRRPVAGVVLVDGTNGTVMTPEVGKPLSVFFSLLALLSRVRLHRKWRGKLLVGITAGLAPDDSERVIRDMLRGNASRAAAAEAKGLLVEAGRLAELEARGFPAGVPVTFMAATVAEPGSEELRERFVAAQRREAEALGQRLVVVTTSRHDIHMQEPTLVAEEVLALVGQYRGTVGRVRTADLS